MDDIIDKMEKVIETDEGETALRELFNCTRLITQGFCQQDDVMFNAGCIRYLMYLKYVDCAEVMQDKELEAEIIRSVTNAHSELIGKSFDGEKLNNAIRDRLFELADMLKDSLNAVKSGVGSKLEKISTYIVADYMINKGKADNNIDLVHNGAYLLYSLHCFSGCDIFNKELADFITKMISEDDNDSVFASMYKQELIKTTLLHGVFNWEEFEEMSNTVKLKIKELKASKDIVGDENT